MTKGFKMKKAIVIGCSGAGKSTFSRKLRDITGLPLVYLDMIWHKSDKTTVSKEYFDLRLNDILKNESWILDGNYGRTLEFRLKECDTVFLFDLPVETCIEGVNSRRGKPREDMPWIEEETDEEFMKWISDFSATHTPEIYRLLEKYGKNKNIFIFKSREEADGFLETLRT